VIPVQDWSFYMPTRIRFGWGRLSEIRQVVGELKGKKIFLATGDGFPKQSDAFQRVLQLLEGIPVEPFAEVEENPSIETVDRGAERCRAAGCDLVIGLGGGSALDGAKAVAMLQRNPGSIREYLDQERVCQTKGLPVIAIPTTAGTGSEVTPFTVITHKAKRAKPAIAPPQNFPEVALVDPELTMTMPPRVAASTGLDVLCQAVEGFWSTQGNPATRALAIQGIRLAVENLEGACLRREKEAVANMALASHLTGIQMSNIGNTFIHPLSYPVTVDCGVPHGFACAVFLPAAIRFNAPAIGERFADLLRLLNLADIEAFARRVEGLMERLGALTRLRSAGVTEEALPDMVKRGIGRSTAWNPRPMKEEDVLQICRAVL
jgi:alcohol dehydrogenase